MPDQPPDDASDGPACVPRPNNRPLGTRPPASAITDRVIRHRPNSSSPMGDDELLADSDQTSVESLTLSAADQTSADSDQLAADRDQAAASDRDLASSVNSRAHEFSRDIREPAARRREQSAPTRLDAADERDEIAYARDLAALVRDQAADARNLALAQRDAACEQDDGAHAVTGAEIVIRAAGQRQRAVRQRTQAAEQDARAAEDRRSAADDREQAACERLHALVDRELLARQLAITEIDALTGARTRAAGLIDLDHELDRCRRTSGVLVVAYVDVVGLKSLNDSVGHGAGDALLKRAVVLIREHLRPYDLIIRLGGDEFLCAMSSMTLPDAGERFSQVAAALAAAPDAAAIRTGFAALTPDETATELIARADSELINPHGNHGSRPAPADDTGR